jgi:quercetin dioxygenase-like cupin family protein
MHPLGWTPIVTAAAPRVRQGDRPVQEVPAGDVVWVPPSQKPCHGVTATPGMTPVAIQEHPDRDTVERMEHITDEQHRR